MSRPEIVENCKSVIVEYLLDTIGQRNIVSVILYGSVARNEESYKYVNGKLFLESDLDLIVVVKNKMAVIKSWLRLKRICRTISDKLRKDWLLSSVNISITTENRLLRARPNLLQLALELNSKVIYGKELIGLTGSYEYKDFPVSALCRTWLFGPMTNLVRAIALSGILEGKKNSHGCNSVLKSIRKLTLFMIRAIIIKESIPVNAFNLSEIKAKGRFYQIKDSAIFNDLLESYDDIKLSDSNEECSMTEIERCLVRVIRQFNLTLAILTGINYPFSSLPKKLIFGRDPLIGRLQYVMYIFLTNVLTYWTTGLFRYIMLILFRPEHSSIRFYDLFISSPNLLKSAGDAKTEDILQRRRYWLKEYSKSLHRWKYDLAGMQ
jgi:predicted nucleotidyltransferase